MLHLIVQTIKHIPMKKLIPITVLCFVTAFAANAQIRTCKLKPRTDVQKETGTAIITKTESVNVVQLVSGPVVKEEITSMPVSEMVQMNEDIDTLKEVSKLPQDIKIIETTPDHDFIFPTHPIIDGIIPEMNNDQPTEVREITIEKDVSETPVQEVVVECVERVIEIVDESDVLVEYPSCKYVGEVEAVEITGKNIHKETNIEASHLDQGTGTGLNEESSAFRGELRLFPNPAIDLINVDFSDYDSASKMQVFDMTGKMVKATYINSNRTTISRENLSKGMYIVRVLDQNNRVLDTSRFSFQ